MKTSLYIVYYALEAFWETLVNCCKMLVRAITIVRDSHSIELSLASEERNAFMSFWFSTFV